MIEAMHTGAKDLRGSQCELCKEMKEMGDRLATHLHIVVEYMIMPQLRILAEEIRAIREDY